jgi:signal transduction histidine kinase
VFAEQAMMLDEALPDGLPLTPEILVPRLGDYLLEKGILQPSELERALTYQKEKMQAGKKLLLGQALRDLGLIDSETLDQVITEQILRLQMALNQANRQLEQRVKDRTLELQQAIHKLTELNQLKSNFIANISHELRTPLTHIKGYLDIMADDGLGPLNSQQTEAVQVLRRSEARLERLIEDLIQFSLASRGELHINISPVDLRAIIKMSEKQLAYKAAESGVSIETRLPDGPLMVRCDEEKILWVVTQLLDNAIKFTPDTGRVLLKISSRDGMATIAVIDTGIGIPEERLAEIFEPFHQLDSSSTRRYAGTGLGLALSNRILEGHGAKLNVRSAVNKGSCFEFSLPVVVGEGVFSNA